MASRRDITSVLQQMFDRSSVALTLADENQEDCPLIAINNRFTEVTGYPAEDVIGRNCRFLQPTGGAGPVRNDIRAFIDTPDRTEGRFLIANVTRDGTPFLNIVYLARLRGPNSEKFILGSQFNVDLDESRVLVYERSLRESLSDIRNLFSDHDWTMLGSMSAIANSAALIAQFRLDREGASE